MATVTSKLTLTSADLLSQNLNISVSKSISADNTTGLARKTITSTANVTASSHRTVHTAAHSPAPAYLCVNNMYTTSTDYLLLYDATTSGHPILLYLLGGQCAFLPIHNSIDLKAYAATTSTPIEFMVIGTEA